MVVLARRQQEAKRAPSSTAAFLLLDRKALSTVSTTTRRSEVDSMFASTSRTLRQQADQNPSNLAAQRQQNMERLVRVMNAYQNGNVNDAELEWANQYVSSVGDKDISNLPLPPSKQAVLAQRIAEFKAALHAPQNNSTPQR